MIPFVLRIAIEDLPEDTPELILSRRLDEYGSLRDERLKNGTEMSRDMAIVVEAGPQEGMDSLGAVLHVRIRLPCRVVPLVVLRGPARGSEPGVDRPRGILDWLAEA